MLRRRFMMLTRGVILVFATVMERLIVKANITTASGAEVLADKIISLVKKADSGAFPASEAEAEENIKTEIKASVIGADGSETTSKRVISIVGIYKAISYRICEGHYIRTIWMSLKAIPGKAIGVMTDYVETHILKKTATATSADAVETANSETVYLEKLANVESCNASEVDIARETGLEITADAVGSPAILGEITPAISVKLKALLTCWLYPVQKGTNLYIRQVYSAVQESTDLCIDNSIKWIDPVQTGNNLYIRQAMEFSDGTID